MSDQRRSCNNDSPIFLLIIWLPLMVVMIITLSNNDDPNSLLTDEQKLEKQKQIELEKQQRELDHLKNVKWWNDGINYFIDEKPMPYTFIVGLLLFGLLIRGFNRRRHYDWWDNFGNSSITIPLLLLIVYIAWVSDFFSWSLL